jgi:hypothetical protein
MVSSWGWQPHHHLCANCLEILGALMCYHPPYGPTWPVTEMTFSLWHNVQVDFLKGWIIRVIFIRSVLSFPLCSYCTLKTICFHWKPTFHNVTLAPMHIILCASSPLHSCSLHRARDWCTSESPILVKNNMAIVSSNIEWSDCFGRKISAYSW